MEGRPVRALCGERAWGPILVATAMLLAWASPSAGQERHRAFTLEMSPVGGALGYAWGSSARRLLGVELGLRTQQFDRTLYPATDPETGSPRFEELLHMALLTRVRRSSSFEVDGGIRVSAASLWGCTASDCWPALFAGGYVQPMVGWERVKVGTRLSGGWIREVPEGRPPGSTWTLWLTPLLVRFTLF